MMKAYIEVLKFNAHDIVTTSNDATACSDPNLLVECSEDGF